MTGRHKFVMAGRLIGWTLRSLGFAAVVSPWRSIYMVPEYFHHDGLRDHELVHIMQMDRDGWRFWPRYIWQIIKFGYERSPYEVEARRLSGC